MVRTDRLNQKEAKKIFEQYGFPGVDLVGEEGSTDFFFLVQHADDDPSFQRKVLQAMEEEMTHRNASPKQYAYLTDRVHINEGKKQIYGTQVQVNEDLGSFEVKPVIEPDKLNERRKKVGLPPIEDYLKMINERFINQ